MSHDPESEVHENNLVRLNANGLRHGLTIWFYNAQICTNSVKSSFHTHLRNFKNIKKLRSATDSTPQTCALTACGSCPYVEKMLALAGSLLHTSIVRLMKMESVCDIPSFYNAHDPQVSGSVYSWKKSQATSNIKMGRNMPNQPS